jgi:hypothetical protein
VRGSAWPYALGIGMLALGFAWLNRGEAMVLHLGLFTWYRAPVAPVILAAFLLGMGAMVAVGLVYGRTER